MSLVLSEQRETMIVGAGRKGDGLWVTTADVERATGWTLKPEGLCRGDVCLPLKPAQRAALVSGTGEAERVDLPGLWRAMGHPVVSDEAGDTWALGTAATARAQALQSLDAPDFTLPDLAGTQVSLSQFRGRKVFLSTWASW